MIQVKEGITEEWLKLFFAAINETSMKRPDFAKFKKAYESRNVVISLWLDNKLVGFGSMLTDWTLNSMIYEVVVLPEYKMHGHGKKIMEELMKKAPESRFYLTSTVGHDGFYKKLGFKRHIAAYALYPGPSQYLED